MSSPAKNSFCAATESSALRQQINGANKEATTTADNEWSGQVSEMELVRLRELGDAMHSPRSRNLAYHVAQKAHHNCLVNTS